VTWIDRLVPVVINSTDHPFCSFPSPQTSNHRQYQLTGRILGVGGFAIVYEAVALKDAAWADGSRWTFRVAKGQHVAAKVMTTRRVDLGCIRE